MKTLSKNAPAKPTMGDAAVKAKTGRDWAAWRRLLDAAGAAKLSHGDIVKLVAANHDAGGWHSQMVAVGYERLRGLRAVNQRRNGLFEAGASKTLPVSAATAFNSFKSDRQRGTWLNEKMVIRTAIAPKSLRITWPDGTGVEVSITARGRQKCTVAVQHGKLPDARTRDKKKAFWKSALDRLAGSVACAKSRPTG